MENMDKAGTHSTNIGADKLAENIPNAPKIVGPIWDFQKKLQIKGLLKTGQKTIKTFSVIMVD